jgi:hypothetical protein
MELPRNQLLVLTFLVVFRLINTSLIRTFFQPDEYFQSLEPAWQKAFGPDSGAYTTWVGPLISRVYLPLFILLTNV